MADKIHLNLPDGFNVPDIYVAKDEQEGDIVLEWIFGNARISITVCPDGQKYWSVVSPTFSAGGDLEEEKNNDE